MAVQRDMACAPHIMATVLLKSVLQFDFFVHAWVGWAQLWLHTSCIQHAYQSRSCIAPMAAMLAMPAYGHHPPVVWLSTIEIAYLGNHRLKRTLLGCC
jgi:hypothetical protein